MKLPLADTARLLLQERRVPSDIEWCLTRPMLHQSACQAAIQHDATAANVFFLILYRRAGNEHVHVPFCFNYRDNTLAVHSPTSTSQCGKPGTMLLLLLAAAAAALALTPRVLVAIVQHACNPSSETSW